MEMIDGYKGIDGLVINYDFDSQFNDKLYHNAKLLLKLYSKVLWSIQNTIMEMDSECILATGCKLIDVVDALIDVDPRIQKRRIESRLQCIEDSKSIVELVDRALLLLKRYPEEGNKYFEILNRTYLSEKKFTESEIIENMNISRSSYFREKKKAISLFGIILWGYIVPDIKRTFQH